MNILNKLVGFYNYSVIATYLGFASGVCGLYLAARGQAGAAIICLLIAGFFDMIDGRIARRCKRNRDEKRFGVQIDSLSDLTCFGVLPAMIGQALGLNHWLCILLLIAYILCGLIRLAYFNVMAAAQEESNSKGSMEYRGLPITSAALIFPLVYVLRPNNATALTVIYGIMMLLTAAAFIAPLTLKKPGSAGLLAICAAGILVIILLFVRGI